MHAFNTTASTTVVHVVTPRSVFGVISRPFIIYSYRVLILDLKVLSSVQLFDLLILSLFYKVNLHTVHYDIPAR
jgi:hypothetical protein